MVVKEGCNWWQMNIINIASAFRILYTLETIYAFYYATINNVACYYATINNVACKVLQMWKPT